MNLKTQARALERSLFEYHFEDGTVDAVVFELGKFQNNDGGFGNALEPDMRSPSSSALATEMGLQTLAKLGVSADDPSVMNAVAYVLNSLDPDTLTWRVVPLDVNDHPHAPWWHDEGGSLARSLTFPWLSLELGSLQHCILMLSSYLLAGCQNYPRQP